MNILCDEILKTEHKEFNEKVVIPEKVEKLYAELLESKRKHESILKFFVANEKVTDSDIVKLKYIVKAFVSLSNVLEEFLKKCQVFTK